MLLKMTQSLIPESSGGDMSMVFFSVLFHQGEGTRQAMLCLPIFLCLAHRTAWGFKGIRFL